MNKIVIRFLAVVLGLFIAEQIVPGISISGLYTAIVVAVCLGILNLLVRPILLVLTLPLTILTFGLFIFILNATMFLFIESFVKGFEIDGFVPALLGSIVVSLISWIIQKIV